jgi:hypothetical protein
MLKNDKNKKKDTYLRKKICIRLVVLCSEYQLHT